MLRFVLTRLSLVVPTFLGIVFITFISIRLVPSDPVLVRTGERGITPERHAQLLHEMGLDRPLYVQFFDYVGNVLQGDFDHSLRTHRPVLDEFLELFPATLELAICAAIFSTLLGLPAGVLAAVRRGSVFDQAVMGTSLAGYSMPIFWWGPILIIVFSLNLKLTAFGGRLDDEFFIDRVTGFMVIDSWLSGEPGAFRSALNHLILPTIVLGTVPLAVIARMSRSSMLDVLGEDYIRTARAKGLSAARVVNLHALRNALIPVVTIIGLQVGALLGGAILTETVFSWPGIGRWLLEAVRQRDYPALQGGTLIVATLVIAVNLSVDLMYGLLNPRIRYKR